jgi:NAD(P)-dependent dehydrogenase (short-subunit alcohol dehydrogenase family)
MSRTGGRWTAADVPDQAGRVAVVTGASGGIGLATAAVLAARGAEVVLACRDMAKASRAADWMRAMSTDATRGGGTARGVGTGGALPVSVRVVRLDLASLASVREAADEIRSGYRRLDLLINNAAVMLPPYQRTPDGFELTFGTNHLGHFALTGLLLDRLLAGRGARIVTVSSVSHWEGRMHFDDLQFERGYDGHQAYGQSKLANLLFSYELHARLTGLGADTISLAAHPGVVRTELWRTSPFLGRAIISRWAWMVNFWAVQDAPQGALPSLRAAVDPGARGGQYYGPSGRKQYRGYPVPVESSARSHDTADGRRLWDISERLTGVSYSLPRPALVPARSDLA